MTAPDENGEIFLRIRNGQLDCRSLQSPQLRIRLEFHDGTIRLEARLVNDRNELHREVLRPYGREGKPNNATDKRGRPVILPIFRQQAEFSNPMSRNCSFEHSGQIPWVNPRTGFSTK